jgi:GT2 family glycosyltransferase
VDGGSTDGTVDVLKRYDPWIARWRSEPDRGVVDAANKALALVTGDLLTWVASDDVLLPGALHAFARAHREAPDGILLGDVRLVDAEGRRTSVERPANVSLQALADPLHSEVTWYGVGMCVPRSLYATNGPFDDSVPYVTDYDWTCRLMLRSAAVHYVRQEVIGFRMHAGSTSVKHRLAQSTQLLEVAERYWRYVPDLDAKVRAEYPLRKASMFLAHDRRWVPLWDRVAGARALFDSFLCYPRIVASPRFLKLCVRAALPKALLRSNPWRTRT